MLRPSTFNRYSAVLITLMAAIPFFAILRLVWGAMSFPMELELREGASWLHVLAQAKGIGIYDDSQVAFFSHGPIDHLFKTAFHLVFPFAQSNVVVRLFVGLLPLSLLGYSIYSLRHLPRLRLACGFLLASILFLAMANLRNYNMLVGRPEPSSVFFLAIQAALTFRIFIAKRAGILLQAVYALTMVLAILTVWRIIPVAGALWLVSAVSLYQPKKSQLLMFIGICLAGLVSVCGVLLFTLYLGSPQLLYKHLVGVFFAQVAGNSAGPWQIFPAEIFSDLTLCKTFVVPVVLQCAVCFATYKKSKLHILTLALSLAAYLSFSYAYHHNKAGAGLHYFSALFIFFWFATLISITDIKLKKLPETVALALTLVLVFVPDWTQIISQIQNLEKNHDQTLTFRNQMSDLERKGAVMSETFHLYKDRLDESEIDQGDMAEDAVRRELVSAAFTATANRFFERVRSGKYTFYLAGNIESSSTANFLKLAYTPIGNPPAYDQMNAPGGCLSILNCPIVWQKK